jgi:hypothetical protein
MIYVDLFGFDFLVVFFLYLSIFSFGPVWLFLYRGKEKREETLVEILKKKSGKHQKAIRRIQIAFFWRSKKVWLSCAEGIFKSRSSFKLNDMCEYGKTLEDHQKLCKRDKVKTIRFTVCWVERVVIHQSAVG